MVVSERILEIPGSAPPPAAEPPAWLTPCLEGSELSSNPGLKMVPSKQGDVQTEFVALRGGSREEGFVSWDG